MINNCWSGFRVWCQKVLPLVYDDSLSYYEVLCKTLKHLDDFAKANEMLESEFDDLKNFVDNYFNNLNVQNEVNNKLDAMLENGSLNNILNNTNWLLNKNIVVYGDSLSADTYNYWKSLKNIYGKNINITNRALGGTALTHINNEDNNGIDLIKNANDLNTFDFIFVCYGTNDWAKSVPLIGSTELAYSYCVEETIKVISTKAPKANIVFITPYFCDRTFYNTPFTNKHGCKIYQYNDTCKKICEKYSVPVIDLYELTSCNELNYKSKLVNDTLGYAHQNEEFSKEIAYIVSNVMTSNFNNAIYKKNMVSDLEFYNYSINWDFSNITDIPLNYLCSPIFLINPSSKIKSYHRHTFIEGNRYHISGYCNKDFTISFMSENESEMLYSVKCFGGIIESDFIATKSGIFNIFIENNSDVQCTFSGLKIYCLDNDNNTNGFMGFFEALNGREGFTENETTNFGYKLENDSIKITQGTLKVLKTIDKGTTIILNNRLSIPETTIIVKTKNGFEECTIKTGGITYQGSNLVTGDTILFLGYVIPINPQSQTR